MAMQLMDQSGVIITGQLKMVFVCDMCGNTSEFWHGMTTYAKNDGNTVKHESYCSEICARKAVA